MDFDEVEGVLMSVDHDHILACDPGGRNKIAGSAPKSDAAIGIFSLHPKLAHRFVAEKFHTLMLRLLLPLPIDPRTKMIDECVILESPPRPILGQSAFYPFWRFAIEKALNFFFFKKTDLWYRIRFC